MNGKSVIIARNIFIVAFMGLSYWSYKLYMINDVAMAVFLAGAAISQLGNAMEPSLITKNLRRRHAQIVDDMRSRKHTYSIYFIIFGATLMYAGLIVAVLGLLFE